MIVHYNKVDKNFFEKLSAQLIEKNFEEIEPFFPLRSDFFHEMIPLFYEINTCLIFECYMASITLTNHTLEKLLKLSLVYNETGLTKEPFKNTREHYGNAHSKFQNSDLSKTINSCCGAGLITKEQKKYLQNEVLEQLRNGFSHSDPNKIIDPKKGKRLFIPTNKGNTNHLEGSLVLDPFLQSQAIGVFAQSEALEYYKNVVEISLHIQKVLIEKEPDRVK